MTRKPGEGDPEHRLGDITIDHDSLLKRFADPEQRIWVYDRESTEVKHLHVSTVAVESFLYAPEDGPDPRDDAIERWLCKYIESRAAHVVQRMVDEETVDLSREERSAVAVLVGAQDTRTPMARDVVLGKLQGMLDQWWKELPAQSERLREGYAERGLDVSEEEILEI